jgi:hypothetical protein
MQEQIKTFETGHRLAGTKHEYWTLKLILNGEVVGVHTSKNQNYILRLKAEWMQR